MILGKFLLLNWFLPFFNLVPVDGNPDVLVYHQVMAVENEVVVFLKVNTQRNLTDSSLFVSYNPNGCLGCNESELYSILDENHLWLVNDNEVIIRFHFKNTLKWDGISFHFFNDEKQLVHDHTLFFKSSYQFPYPDFILYSSQGIPLFHQFLSGTTQLVAQNYHSGSAEYTAYYYQHNFLPALPPMAEPRKSESQLSIDSIFQFTDTSETIYREGLYFVQRDTNSFEGISFLKRDRYFPELVRPEDLADAFRYILKSEEFEDLMKASDTKKAFDRLVLELSPSPEHARQLIKSYFFRVRMANLMFTTYKEGWKNDMGMIFIIFGWPDGVRQAEDQVIWKYQFHNKQDIRFEFFKVKTIFSDAHFVLKRKQSYDQPWLEAVELWRNARIR
jgi:GWxTD domain-containing protein